MCVAPPPHAGLQGAGGRHGRLGRGRLLRIAADRLEGAAAGGELVVEVAGSEELQVEVEGVSFTLGEAVKEEQEQGGGSKEVRPTGSRAGRQVSHVDAAPARLPIVFAHENKVCLAESYSKQPCVPACGPLFVPGQACGVVPPPSRPSTGHAPALSCLPLMLGGQTPPPPPPTP
jgi:hypothetical protein